jgi:phosphomannomutase
MSLIKSISGIRGTIGGNADDGLNPLNIVKFVCGYYHFITSVQKDFCIRKNNNKLCAKIIVGRDARMSGEMVNNIVCGTFAALGVDVIDIGLSTTPTVEMAVILSKADGGIIITASHNPKNWNALKLLNHKGEFLSEEDGKKILEYAENMNKMVFAEVNNLGKYSKDDGFIEKHINEIVKLRLVDIDAIKQANFKIVIDTVNSTGSLALPPLLKRLGVEQVININSETHGNFAHNPEPLPENIKEICKVVKNEKADVGFVVDPDVDRLAIVMENGEVFGEEYTLVAVADYVLQNLENNTPATTVSNMSSSRALKIITEKHGAVHFASAVGEVNVIKKMKEVGAVIGGEGNGGVIYPELHYGRDALVGIALFLSFLGRMRIKGMIESSNDSKFKARDEYKPQHINVCKNLSKERNEEIGIIRIQTVSELRTEYPNLYISKNKIELKPDTNVDILLQKVMEKFENIGEISDVDGVKIDFPDGWIHIRKSNTEPIIRIYTEGRNEKHANELYERINASVVAIMQ